MARLVTLGAAVLAIATATAVYALKFDTARIEDDVQRLERAIEKADGDIAVLKAERAYLGRPDRIETLARRLGLEPIQPGQYRRLPAETAAAFPGRPAAVTDADALAAARAILAPGQPSSAAAGRGGGQP